MSLSIRQDIDHFFSVYQSRTEEVLSHLPSPIRADLEEELSLLRESVQNRLAEARLP